MNEHFRDAIFHLKLAARHTQHGISESVAHVSTKINERRPTQTVVRESTSTTEQLQNRVRENLEGARRRITR